MEFMDLLSSVFRWFHIAAGLLFIGLSWWFNFVFVPFSLSADPETRGKALLGIVPRAFYWFRWSAIYTVILGLGLLISIFYAGGQTIEGQASWTVGSYIMVVVVFMMYRVYVLLANSPLGKNNRTFGIISFILIAILVNCLIYIGNFSYRGYVIHIGVLFGIIMVGNVWETMWPAQKKIFDAVKSGNAPDPVLFAKVSQRGLHNVYLSVPLLWTMIEAHTEVPASDSWLYLMGAIAVGWGVVYLILKKSHTLHGW
jgi:uncharacterized membrane protein